jgi:hypothetical protein
MLTGSSTSGSVAGPDPGATVRVWTYNYTGLQPEALRQAQREASRVFGRIAVSIEWVDCPKSEAERELSPNCLQDVHHTPVVLRVFSGRPSSALGSSRTAFGMAYLADDGNGNLADVYAPEPGLAEVSSSSERAKILGHFMVHEMGHLFLASKAHSSKGIMRAHWNSSDLVLALSGGLVFNSEQSKRIVSNLKARTARIQFPATRP